MSNLYLSNYATPCDCFVIHIILKNTVTSFVNICPNQTTTGYAPPESTEGHVVRVKRQPGETSRIWCTSRSRQTYPSPPRGPSSRAQRANRADPPSPRGNGRICPRRCTSTSRATRGCLSWTSPVRSHHRHPPITPAEPARDPRYPPAPTLASPALGPTPQLSTSDFAFRFLDNDPTACADRGPIPFFVRRQRDEQRQQVSLIQAQAR